MENIELYWQSEQVLEFIISVGIPALAAIVTSIVLWYGGVELAARVRATAKSLRKYVDEPTDQAVLALEGIGEFVFKRDLDPKEISRVVTAVMAAFEEAEPLAERERDHAAQS